MAGEHILVVDDEEDILELIRFNLEKEGYKTTCVTSGKKALELARTRKFNMVVLDLMLPDLDGYEITKALKNNGKTRKFPILMLTAKGEEGDVVTGLELGADDYMAKPFSPKVLVARIRVILRRLSENETSGSPDVYTRHGLMVHQGMHVVTFNDKTVDLTPSEFQILCVLMRRPGWAFSRSQMVDAIRGDNYAVTDRSIDVQIVGLRKKLGDAGQYVETVRGIGYRFKE